MESCNPFLLQLELLPPQFGYLLAGPPLVIYKILSRSPPGVTAPLGRLHGNHIVGLSQEVGKAHQLQWVHLLQIEVLELEENSNVLTASCSNSGIYTHGMCCTPLGTYGSK
jgi:hypothetical protein